VYCENEATLVTLCSDNIHTKCGAWPVSGWPVNSSRALEQVFYYSTYLLSCLIRLPWLWVKHLVQAVPSVYVLQFLKGKVNNMKHITHNKCTY